MQNIKVTSRPPKGGLMIYKISAQRVKVGVFSVVLLSLSVFAFISISGMRVQTAYVTSILFLFFSLSLKVKRDDLFFFASFLPYFSLSIMSSFWSESQSDSIRYSFQAIILLCWMFLIVQNMDNSLNRCMEHGSRFVAAVTAVMLLVFFYNAALVGGGAEHSRSGFGLVEKGIYRFIGLGYDPNFQAFFMLFVFSWAIFFLKENRLFVLTVLAVGIVATLSRSAFVFFVLIGLVYMSRYISLAFLFLSSVFVSVLYFFAKDSVFLEKRLSGLETGSGRFDIWRDSVEVFYDNPILGSGLGSFKKLNEASGLHAHNTFIEILVSIGTIGMFLFLVPVFYVIFKLFSTKGKVFYCGVCVLLCWFGLSLTLTAFGSPIFYFMILFVYALPRVYDDVTA